MSGIYIHVPFCKKACSYCDFYFVTAHTQVPQYVEALLWEIEENGKAKPHEKIETLYFGGGTPSRLSAAQFESIFKALNKSFRIDTNAEITVECNPEDISAQYLSGLKKLGVNRLSVGLQSLKQNQLQWMHRAHSAQQSIDALETIVACGFTNYSVDFIYGLPNQDFTELKENLDILKKYKVPHVSCYALTVEPNTPLYHSIKKGRTVPATDDAVSQQFIWLSRELQSLGYEHYEVSNFAQKGFRAVHNSNYWKRKNCLAFGPGAHGFSHGVRYFQEGNLKRYLDNFKQKKLEYQEEFLSEAQKYNEFVLTQLRRTEGILLAELETLFPEKFVSHFHKQVAQLKKTHDFKNTETALACTTESWLLADALALELFWDEEP